MKTQFSFAAAIALLFCGGYAAGATAQEPAEADEARGKYLLEIGGCNDCHTSTFAMRGGEVPESEWLLGDSIGFRGPWGTTYASNLRTFVGKLTQDQWVAAAKVLRTRPPMPWWALNAMTDEDLAAIYRYIRTLEPVPSKVPAYVPPGEEPSTPYIQWPSE